MTILTCFRCGATIAVVRDGRFGLAPTESLCLGCSHPALRA